MPQSVAFILLTLAAPATSLTDDAATQTIKSRDAEIRATIKASKQPEAESGDASNLSPALRDKLEQILTRAIDLEEMSKDALGKHWDDQTPAKRQEFLDAFHRAFRSAMRGQIEFYTHAKTEFGKESREGDRIRVPTSLIVKGEPTDLTYVMAREGKDWRIVDIIIDDVSTVENYRASFNRIISKEGFEGLLARLKKKPEVPTKPVQ